MTDSNDNAELIKRIERLEAIEDIKVFRKRSAVAADPSMDIDMLVGLYTKDGIIEYPTFGTIYKGQDEIRAFLEVNPFTWMFHCLIPLEINVAADCQSASARWYLWETATVHNTKTGNYDPVWVAGAYDDEMIKVAGEWKFTHTILNLELLCQYEDGWRADRVKVSEDWGKEDQALMNK